LQFSIHFFIFDRQIYKNLFTIQTLAIPKISEKNGKPILDEVLLLNLNPQTLQGEIRELYGHQFVCLNPNHPNSETPKQIRDWLDLIYQSIHSPERPVLNMQNEGIRKAMELISFENLTPEERTKAKNKEAAKIVLTKEKVAGKQEEKIEIAKKAIQKGFDNETIAELTDLTVEQIEALCNEKG